MHVTTEMVVRAPAEYVNIFNTGLFEFVRIRSAHFVYIFSYMLPELAELTFEFGSCYACCLRVFTFDFFFVEGFSFTG